MSIQYIVRADDDEVRCERVIDDEMTVLFSGDLCDCDEWSVECSSLIEACIWFAERDARMTLSWDVSCADDDVVTRSTPLVFDPLTC